MKTTMAQAVRNAVEIERQAGRFYRELAESNTDGATRRFLEGLSAQEMEHLRSVECLVSRLGGRLPEWQDFNVDTIETPPDWSVWAQIDLRAALTIALEAERRAALYYGAMGDTETGEVAAFFRNLVEVEQAHAEMILEKIRELDVVPAGGPPQPGTWKSPLQADRDAFPQGVPRSGLGDPAHPGSDLPGVHYGQEFDHGVEPDE